MKQKTPREQIVCPFTHPRPLRVTTGLRVFLKWSYCIANKSVEQHTNKMIDLMHTIDLLVYVKRPDFEIVQISTNIFRYQT